jgi:5'-nucleotidase
MMLATTLAALTLLAGCGEKKQDMAQTAPASAQPEPMTFEGEAGPEAGQTNSGGETGTYNEGGPTANSDSGSASAPPPQRMDMPPAETDSGAADKRTYTIQDGDTLYSLAKRFYGDGQQWQRIADANPDISPEKLPVGKQIAIPGQ